MTPSSELLSRWQPERLQAAAARLDEVASELRLVGTVCVPAIGWTGVAAAAHVAMAKEIVARTSRLGEALLDCAEVLRRAAGELLDAQRDLAVARWLATCAGWALADDGDVVPSRPPQELGQWPAEAQARARGALERATSSDRRAARGIDEALLRAVAPGPEAFPTPWLRRPAGPPLGLAVGAAAALGAEPSAVAAWWERLAWSARSEVLRGDPQRLGAAEGIPVAVRDVANRRVLRQALAGRLTPGRGALLEAVRRSVAGPQRALLLLDLGSRRAAVAVGDLDTADHVAVLVPGMNSDVTGDLRALARDAARVRATAEPLTPPGETVAVVAWLGYLTPSLTGVASERRARVGAQQLIPALRGIRARARPVHLTLVGHSYGSLTAGLAVQEGAPVDDLVVVGSPGVGVARASQLGLARRHVLVGEARGDLAADLGRFEVDPGSGGFGASELPTRKGVDSRTGEPLRASHGHSDYYSAGTTSLHAIAGVVAGTEGARAV